MKLKKYAISFLVLVCMFALVGMSVYFYNEKAWKTDFVTVSTGISYPGENYIPQPPGCKIGEMQVPNQFIQYEDEIYYTAYVMSGNNVSKIYVYNTKSKETKFVYATREGDERNLYKFTTNGNKLILLYSEGEASVVDLFTQIERKLDVQKFQDVAVCGHEIIYLMADGSVWRQNIRSDKGHKLDGINAYSIALYDGVIYYEDIDNSNYISKYDMNTGEIVKTDEELRSFFMVKNGELVQYE